MLTSSPLSIQLEPGTPTPEYGTQGAAAFDVTARIDAPITLRSLERKVISTGIRAAIPEGHALQVLPRSGLAAKRGLGVLNSPGLIDSDYRGVIGVIAVNLSQNDLTIEPGERIAQLMLVPYVRAQFQVVDALDETARGEGGFGSTGT